MAGVITDPCFCPEDACYDPEDCAFSRMSARPAAVRTRIDRNLTRYAHIMDRLKEC